MLKSHIHFILAFMAVVMISSGNTAENPDRVIQGMLIFTWALAFNNERKIDKIINKIMNR